MLVQVDYTLFLSGELAGADSPVSDVMLTIGIDQLGVMNSYVRWLAVGTVDHVVGAAGAAEPAENITLMAPSREVRKQVNLRDLSSCSTKLNGPAGWGSARSRGKFI